MLVHKARGMHQVSVLRGAGNQPMSSTAHCSLSDLAEFMYVLLISSHNDDRDAIEERQQKEWRNVAPHGSVEVLGSRHAQDEKASRGQTPCLAER